jgi:hypothetical protein
VTEGAVANDRNRSCGCAWADYDNDGDLDLFVANGVDNTGQVCPPNLEVSTVTTEAPTIGSSCAWWASFRTAPPSAPRSASAPRFAARRFGNCVRFQEGAGNAARTTCAPTSGSAMPERGEGHYRVALRCDSSAQGSSGQPTPGGGRRTDPPGRAFVLRRWRRDVRTPIEADGFRHTVRQPINSAASQMFFRLP